MPDKYPIHWHHVFELVLTKPGQVLPLIRRAVDDFLWLLNRSWTGEAPHAFFGLKNLPPPEKPEKRLLTLFIHDGLGPC